MRYSIYFVVLVLLLSCKQEAEIWQNVFALPKKVKKFRVLSTLMMSCFYAVEDSSNKNVIWIGWVKAWAYVKIVNATNVDWEALRKDLCIYKIQKDSLTKRNFASYRFHYPEQNIPLFYDVKHFLSTKVAFIFYKKSSFDGTTLLYGKQNSTSSINDKSKLGSYENNAMMLL
jgi:hypothetical protein